MTETFCGYVTIVGRPNVGKSTLLNHMLKQKLSITSRKPQTTRNRIVGVKTVNEKQIIFIDTPGLHSKEPRAINRYMNQTARSAIQESDVILFMVEALKWTEEDELALKKIKPDFCPVLLIVNKVDKIVDKTLLFEYLKNVAEKFDFKEVIPTAALKGKGIEILEERIMGLLPKNPHYFPNNQITDRNPRFLVAELIREQLIRMLGNEVPYSISVEIEQFEKLPNLYRIAAIIWVERTGQKAIVIGTEGERLKEIGTRARMGIEKLLDRKTFIQLWVKVKDGWSDDERALKSLGYFDFD